MASAGRARALALVMASALAACGGAAPAPHAPPPGAAAPAPEEPAPHGTFTQSGNIGTYVSIPWGFSTTSYVLEGPEGLVAIDTQFLPSAAEEMIALAETATKKKFVLAIVLHANPDKFNGTATFQKHGVKVVTSAQVKALLPSVHAMRKRSFYERYQPDYPSEAAAPDVFGDKTTELRAAGLALKLHVMGAGCSEAHVVAELPGPSGSGIFAGDLVANHAHSWLEIGKTDEWLKRIDEMKKLKPARVYPGRGLPGETKLLDDEDAYLKKVMQLIAAANPRMPIPDDGSLERVEQAVVAAYPDYTFPFFLKIGLPAEWERQARMAKR